VVSATSDQTSTVQSSATADLGVVPSAPTVTITSTGGVTTTAQQIITGTVDVAHALTTLTVFEGANALGSAVVQADGTWSAPITLSGGGQHTLVAKDTEYGVTGSSNPIVFTLNLGPVTWITGRTGDWSNAANWSSGSVPDATDAVVFVDDVTPVTVTGVE